jgi:uncharacterized damage-inducible protein DinB
MKDPRYPIGPFEAPASISPQDRTRLIGNLATAPAKLRAAVRGLSDEKLDTPYREGGWTVRQVIHHVPESHMNAYIRFKLALTETDPVVKPYDEAAWAKLPDIPAASIEASLSLLENLHERWVVLLRALREDDWKKRYIHPAQGRAVPLDEVLALYSWHGDHHIAHVTGV